MKEKLSNVLKKIYGYGIMISLFSGGATFFGYLLALILGGEAAEAICEMLKSAIIPVIINLTSILVVIGLIAMYLSGEIALSVNDKRKK